MAHEENEQKLLKETLCNKYIFYSMETIPFMFPDNLLWSILWN